MQSLVNFTYLPLLIYVELVRYQHKVIDFYQNTQEVKYEDCLFGIGQDKTAKYFLL